MGGGCSDPFASRRHAGPKLPLVRRRKTGICSHAPARHAESRRGNRRRVARRGSANQKSKIREKTASRILITFALMKTVTAFALAFFASSLLVFGQESNEEKSNEQKSNEENAAQQTEREENDAYLNSDADGIARGVMEDYTLTNSTGKITTRAHDLDEATKKNPKYDVFENTGMKVRVHGNTAVVTGQTHTKGVSGGKPFDSKFQFTDTFIKDAGRWRLLAGHVSKLGWGTRLKPKSSGHGRREYRD